MKNEALDSSTPKSEFIKGKPCSIFYENIDFLTVRLSENGKLIRKLNGLVNNNESHFLDLYDLKIVYCGLIAGDELKVLQLQDSQNNVLAFIHIKQIVLNKDGKQKTNKNFGTDIEFVGLFFYQYFEIFDYICELFEIDRDKNGILKRIDYCFDVAGLVLDDFIKFRKESDERTPCVFIGKTMTYYRIKNKRHDLVLYDKKFQILDEKKFKQKISKVDKFSGKLTDNFIFKHYLETSFPITRMEYRKRSEAIAELGENSINHFLNSIRSYAVSYFNSKYDLDFNNLLDYKETKPRIQRKDKFNSNLTNKKIDMYLQRSMAYADNYTLLKSETVFFTHLQQKYGDRIIRFFVNADKRLIDIAIDLFNEKNNPK